MGLRQLIKDIYFKNIKKMSVHDIRIDHLRKVGVSIGENTWIFSDHIETNESYLISIGNNCIISDCVAFTTHDASAFKYLSGKSDIVGRITIGDRVFIGIGSIVLPGVTIADDCIVGAGSVVTKSVLIPGSVIAGNPARVVSTIEELKTKNEKYTLDMRGMSYLEKKQYLLKNEDKFKQV